MFLHLFLGGGIGFSGTLSALGTASRSLELDSLASANKPNRVGRKTCGLYTHLYLVTKLMPLMMEFCLYLQKCNTIEMGKMPAVKESTYGKPRLHYLHIIEFLMYLSPVFFPPIRQP